MLTLRRASFSTDSDRTICWISGSLCRPQHSKFEQVVKPGKRCELVAFV